MPYRLQEYKMEIIKSAIDEKRVRRKEYKLPEVIPIVIYTGKEKWGVRRELNNIEEERLKGIDLIKYNLIDINRYREEELRNSREFIDKIFLIEKAKGIKEFEKRVKEVSKSLTNEEEKEKMQEIIEGPIRKKLGEEKIREIIKEMRGDEEEMLGAVEMVIREYENARENGLRDGIKEGRKEGRKEGIRQMVINMLKSGINEEQVRKISGITEKELKKFKKIYID